MEILESLRIFFIRLFWIYPDIIIWIFLIVTGIIFVDPNRKYTK